MNWTLLRTDYDSDGILGELRNEHGDLVAYTLEHAFLDDKGCYAPKVPVNGIFLCQLGTHQLDHGGPFEAYEITGIPNHTGILFHIGNFNKDSDGCVLLGMHKGPGSVLDSKTAFINFMNILKGIQEFTLEVKNKI